MQYSYRIAGRTPGNVTQTEYSGQVEANTPKQAMLAALANQFGDTDVTDPTLALTGTGWVDSEILNDNFVGISDDENSMEFYAEEHSYAIEVLEAS